MSRVLHISDPHFGTERKNVAAALQRFVQDARPDLIVLTGDITQRARRSQFASARDFLAGLPAPVLAVPGNHDIPLFNILLRVFNPYGNYRRAFGNVLEPVFESEDLLVLGVNTSRAGNHKDGEVSTVQIARVATRLAGATPRQLRVVAQHHPVRAHTETDLSNLLIGREHAIPAWVDAGMDILLAGHIQLSYVHPLGGNSGATGWTVQAGTALSSRVRGNVPNSVNLIHYRASGNLPHCSVERWDHIADEDCFRLVEDRPLELSRAL